MVKVQDLGMTEKVRIGDPEKGWKGYINEKIKVNLDRIKKVIRKDWDFIFIVDGMEGAGKSVLAQQLAWYCDPTIEGDITRICFSPDEFSKAIKKSPKYTAVIYDEAMEGMNSRAAMSQVNRMLNQTLAQIRQKNLFIFIVLPSFFELDKYPAIHRSRGLFHVYTDNQYNRGKCMFYGEKRKRTLYLRGKKVMWYGAVTANFTADFNKGYIVSEEEYRKKKNETLTSRKEKELPSMMKKKAREHQARVVWTLYKFLGTYDKMGEVTGIPSSTLKTLGLEGFRLFEEEKEQPSQESMPKVLTLPKIEQIGENSLQGGG